MDIVICSLSSKFSDEGGLRRLLLVGSLIKLKSPTPWKDAAGLCTRPPSWVKLAGLIRGRILGHPSMSPAYLVSRGHLPKPPACLLFREQLPRKLLELRSILRTVELHNSETSSLEESFKDSSNPPISLIGKILWVALFQRVLCYLRHFIEHFVFYNKLSPWMKMCNMLSELARYAELPKSVDSKPTMEETILVGDDLMMGPPSPLIPPEIASHVLEGLQINDIEPFCQDEIAIYRQCAEKRDKELRQRLQDSERKLGMSMPLEQAKERCSQLESEATSLERHLILASGVEGMEGFRQRWSLHGRLTDTKKRLDALKQGMENRKKDESVGESTTKKRWFFW
ncbi:UNVERIFIED_CONTAM: hypothetical protein Sindi_0575400 [Sesamum indicum]